MFHSVDDYEANMLNAFIQKDDKLLYYLNNYKKLIQDGEFKYKFSWSWSGFFFTWLLLLYRKSYIYAIIGFFLFYMFDSFALTIILMLMMGSFSNFLILKKYHDKKVELENSIEDEEDRIIAMHNYGGNFSILLMILIFFLALVSIGTIFYYSTDSYFNYSIIHHSGYIAQ